MDHMQDHSEPEKVNAMLKTWRPQPTVLSTVIQSCVAGWLLIAVAIPIFLANSSVVQFTVHNYDTLDQCSNLLHNTIPCNITLQLTKPMNKPVYLLYEISNFYKNYKRYFTSKSNYQLQGIFSGDDIGNPLTVSESIQACSPVVLNSDLYTNLSWGGYTLNASAPASPCGLVAKTYFNDTFSMFYPNGTQVEVS